MSSVICLEFNELTPSLMDAFISQGHLPNFEKFRNRSIVHTTDANADAEWLNPWVQWVTVHSGLDAAEHEVYRLSNAYKLNIPAVWDLISAAGKKSWICGSMNPWSNKEFNGFMLPDPWSHQFNAYPENEFADYDKFVRKNVQEYAAKKSPVTIGDRIKFVSYMLNHGLHLSTIKRICLQIIKERIGKNRWKRPAVLDAIQYDLFEWYYKKHQPQFATYFSNSTAHYQHKYWRNMEPEKFTIRPTASEQRSYKDAILYGYKQMDGLLGRVMNLAPDATIMLISGLSQKPYQEKDHEGGVRYYRLHDKKTLIEKLNIKGDFSYEPIMADEFFLRFVNEIDAEACVVRLKSILLPDGSPAFDAELDGSDVIAQCKCRQFLREGVDLKVTNSDESIDFHEVFYWVDSIKSGTHHPDGLFWISRPGQKPQKNEKPVPLTTVAPTILDCLNIPKPAFMQEDSVLMKKEERSTVPELEPVLAGL